MFEDIDEEILKIENELYKQIDQYYHEFDVNNNGFIDSIEFKKCLEKVMEKTQNPEVKERILNFKEQMIISVSKTLNKEQFRIVMSSMLLENFTMNEMIEMFRIFDKKRDGKICADELVYIFKNLGLSIDNEIAKELINEASYNGKDYMDFEEFARMMLSK